MNLTERRRTSMLTASAPLLATSLLASTALAATNRVDPAAEPDVPSVTIDLGSTSPATHAMIRVHGPDRNLGDAGVPVAGGYDCDGDGRKDYAVGHFLSSPLGRQNAGEVNLVFGDGSVNDSFDTRVGDPLMLRVLGAGNLGERECTGSEIWMGDLTGDGLGDLILCRQNYSFNDGTSNRIGAGALTVIVGGQAIRDLAAAGTPLDLANPPAGVNIFSLLGPHNNSRLGIWARVGDVDGDGVEDLLVAADQEQTTAIRAGAAYVLRGGSHVDQSTEIDLADFGTTAMAGQLAKIVPPANAFDYHLGSTNQTGDMDNNGRVEILLSAALNRAGAAVGPSTGTTDPVGGAPPNGWAFVVWDDNFPAMAPWPAGYTVDLANPTGSVTTIRGGVNNDTFGEELLGGMDYDGDGNGDLFIGDLTGDGTGGSRPWSGVGYVFYNAETLKGMNFDVDQVPSLGIAMTTILGPSNGAIGADTVADGDLDGDGFDDLIFGSPTDNPLGRNGAGSIQIFFGKAGGWPALIDTAPGQFPAQSVMRITEVLGANGSGGFGDSGDTLCYSAAAGDLDDDGKVDLFVNEMRGNGTLSNDVDAGNLLVLTGSFLLGDTESIGTPFCTAAANSTGVPGRTSALGSTDVADSDLQLEAADLPLNSMGYFIVSDTQGFVAGPGGSDGNLCLGGNIGRFAGDVRDSQAHGSFTLWVDPLNLPSPTGGVSAMNGQTWSFQAWHRDTNAMGSTSNFTEGLAITFQ